MNSQFTSSKPAMVCRKLSLLLLPLVSTMIVATSSHANVSDWPFPEPPKGPATPNPITDLGSCKIITDGLIVIPGLAADPVNTSHFGDEVQLSETITGRDLILILDLKGTTGAGNPNIRKIETRLGSMVGSDYRSYFYEASNATDELRGFTADLEIIEHTSNDAPKRAILSTLSRSTAKNRTGKEFIRTMTARYFCDLKTN